MSDLRDRNAVVGTPGRGGWWRGVRSQWGRAWRGAVLVGLVAAAGGAAQEGPSPAELKRMYDDAVTQLKGAQARRNELAAENEKLSARLAELERKVTVLESKNAAMEMEASNFAERTWHLRSTVAAWREFLAADPALKARWERFLTGDGQGSLGMNGAAPGWLGRGWPLSGRGGTGAVGG